jgi:hypothetical protein
MRRAFYRIYDSIAYSISGWFAVFIVLVTIVFAAGSATLPAGKIHQHHVAVTLAKEQRLARGAKQVTKYRHLVAGYSKQLNSLTDQYGTSNALMSTLKPEGEKPVHDVVNKINQLNLKVLQVPADAPKKDQLDDEMKKLTETAQHWSDASTH